VVIVFWTSEEQSHKYEREENITFCGFCHIKYCDPVLN